jgi:hypothetical protein
MTTKPKTSARASAVHCVDHTTVTPTAQTLGSGVAVIDAKTCIVAADIQWVIQKRRREGRWALEGVYFCRSKADLLLYAPKPTAPELLALPDWFPELSA